MAPHGVCDGDAPQGDRAMPTVTITIPDDLSAQLEPYR
jgi:hypothetical protein